MSHPETLPSLDGGLVHERGCIPRTASALLPHPTRTLSNYSFHGPWLITSPDANLTLKVGHTSIPIGPPPP